MTNAKLTPGRLERIRRDHSAGDHYAELGQADIGLLLGEIDAAYSRGFAVGSGNEGEYQREIARLRETLNCPQLTAQAPAAQFKAVLDQAEKGEPVNTMDLINALWWRVRNQKREIARLHATIGGES